MAARVDVLEGPDKGWRYTVVAGDARVGRGPGCQIRLTDPAWPVGSIRIRLHRGGHLVSNDLPHPVYLDGEPLPPGQERTLHHGATIQPTRGTLLRLGIVAAPAAADGPVVAEPPAPARRLLTLNRVLTGLLVLTAVALQGHAYVRGAPGVNGEEANRIKDAIAALEADPAVDARAVPHVRAARAALTRAVYDDASGRPAEALGRYRTAQQETERAARVAGPDDPAVPTLRAAAEFVTARLRATTGR